MIARVLIGAAVLACAAAGVAEAKKKPEPEQTWRILLYEDKNYGGEVLDLDRDVPDLDDLDFENETSSVNIISGYWELCEDPNYRGTCVKYGPGSSPEIAKSGFRNDRLESLRRLQPPGPPPPPPKPDLTRRVEARSSYDAVFSGEGDARVVASVAFRGVTVRVTVSNDGEETAGASTLRIEPGSKMAAALSYIAAGEHDCGGGKVPWPSKEGRQADCVALQKGEILATAAGTALTCSVPKLEPGESARCVGVFSVLYNYLVPQFGDWYVVATADAGKRVDEDNEKNNGAGEQIKVKGDDLPPP